MNGNELTFNGRLPGVLCETSVPARTEDPLRLDVAGFVGFAPRGPLHTPVMIEDLSQYQLIFGQDLPLAVDAGLPIYAHLPSAVEAFFEHGGRRCYVVRVAGESSRANQFVLPGLLQSDTDNQWQPITLAAAWHGGWSDFMSLSTSLRSQPLRLRNNDDLVRVQGTALLAGTFSLPLLIAPTSTVASNNIVRSGDLLRLHVERADTNSLIAYAQVQGVNESADGLAPSLLGNLVDVQVTPGSVRIFDNMPGNRTYRRIDQLTAQGWTTLPVARPDIGWHVPETLGGTEPYRLTLPVALDLSPDRTNLRTGDLLRLQANAGQPVTFFTIDQIQREQIPGEQDEASEYQLVLESVQPLQERRTLNAAQWTVTQVDLLTLDLSIREGEETLEEWHDLRFGAGENSWRTILAQEIDPHNVEPAAFTVDQFSRRSLRLGGAELSAAMTEDAMLYPLGMSPIRQNFGPIQSTSGDDVGKDGLDEFDPETLFVDEAFGTVTSRNVMAVANDLLYTSPTPRRLRGLHSLLPIADVSLIALPDLAHNGWQPLLVPPFTMPTLPDPEEEPPSGFHDCPVDDPEAPQEEECPALPVTILDRSTLLPEPNIQAILEDLPDLVAPTAYDPEPMLAVQRVLIRLCAAQADRMAIVTLPRHYRGRVIEEWHESLVSTPEFFDGFPLSYAASYHGWVGVRETTPPVLAPLRYTPPDGALCGLIAAREIERGAWIAPANQSLRTVSDLAPNFSDTEWFTLYNLQLNILRQQPGRFALMSALTLSRNRLLTQISVRRLLIFLRKLAIREGQRYVFESNNERFRASVQIRFERILEQLREVGGVMAYQVVTNEEVNTPNDIDNGRLIIALKIAPTSPIEFITVILLRSGDDGIDILEI